MAKSLAERITSAKSTDRVTITDLETLIADATAERERLVGSAAHHDGQSIDFALSDEDREEASRLASHFQRTARGLGNEITALNEKLEAKRNSEARKAEEAIRAAIIARRDEAAARFAERGPALVDELIGLLSDIEASDEEMAAARIHQASAEAIARGIDPSFYQGPSPLARFTKLKIPAWDGPQNAWPIDRHAAAMLKLDQENHRRAVARAAEERNENARWSRYAVQQPEGLDDNPTIETRRGPVKINRPMIEAEMTAEAVADAMAKGCLVRPLNGNERIGLPRAVEVIA